MAGSNSYQQILEEYPEFITKEQLYQICHISKKSAQNLLESGEIPCVDSGRKTHRFLIATADVVDYLHRRDNAPRPAADETAVEKIRAALALYPDVLSVAPVSYTHLDVYKRQVLAGGLRADEQQVFAAEQGDGCRLPYILAVIVKARLVRKPFFGLGRHRTRLAPGLNLRNYRGVYTLSLIHI